MMYWDHAILDFRPSAGAGISWTECDQYENQCYGSGWEYTDANGYYSIQCAPTPYYTVDTEFHYENSEVKMDSPGGSRSEYFEDCGTNQVVYAEGSVSWAYYNMVRFVGMSRDYFQTSRSQIRVWITNGSNNRYYKPTFFQEERIELTLAGESNFMASPAWGMFIMGHEYGHALHEEALGGMHGDCGQSHTLGIPENLGCAFKEGFANYHAVALAGSEAGEYFTGIENDDYYPGGDGSVEESSVAAYLLDLTDPPNAAQEPWDVVQYPGSFVAATIRDCRVQIPPNWGPVDGVDVFVWCVQRGGSSIWTTTYFSTRGAYGDTPTIVSNAAPPFGFNPDGNQRAWLKNLYNRDVF